MIKEKISLNQFYVFCITQILFQIIPLVYVYKNSGEVYQIKALVASIFSLSIFCVTFFLADKSRNSEFRANCLPNVNLLNYLTMFYLALTPILYFWHVLYVGNVPLLNAFSGSSSLELSYSRELFFKQLPLYLQLIFLINEQIIPFFLLVFLISFSESSRLSNILVWLIFSWLVMVSILGLVKMAPVIAVLLLITSKYYQEKITLPKLIFYSLFSSSIILYFMKSAASGADGSKSFFEVMKDAVVRRIFTLQADVLNAYFSCFPNNTEHLHGFGIRIISMIFGDSNFQLSNFVYKFMYPSGPLDSGWANSGYIAEAWADFGWLGVILYPILLGLIVVKTGKIIAINKSCCPQKAMVLEVFSSFILAYLSISSALSSVILITIIILCLMIKFLFIEVRSI